MADNSTPASTDGALATYTGINSPGLTPSSTKPKRRALSDVDHVMRLVDTLMMARRSQNEKNGRIQGKLNSERPYDENQLKSEGLGYKSNFSTKPLSTTVGKVSSRLTKSIQSARYLTSAELPDAYPDAKKKTELFRRELTNLVRRWDGWYNFCNEVASEDAIFGWATATWLDELTWRPKFFRQDNAYLPDGTKQTTDGVQFVAFREYVFPHELAIAIEDRKAATDAGWEIDNVVESINNARPPSIPGAQTAPYTDFRRYEDAIRESSVSLSLVGGAKQVTLWHVLAVEIDGQVSHYIADGDSRKLLFSKLDRFASVSDCLALLSFEHAQTLMGSKGIGREIYEIANVVDRARNEVVDRLQLSGKLIVQGPENQLTRFKLSVIGNVILIPEGFTISQNKIEAAVNEFIELDQLLTQLLDQIAGGVTPRRFEGERVTKAEIELFAQREEEKRDDITTRFVTQFAAILSTIQRRAYSGHCTDEDAKRSREKLLQHMSKEELDELINQPALRTIEDYTQTDAQKIVILAKESRNDPLYNHKEMEKRKLAVLVDPDFAEAVLLPDNDPTETAEQVRQQLEEDQLLEKGKQVPVSPRDNHIIHIEVMKTDLEAIAQAAGGGDAQATAVLELFVQHWEQHLQAALETGADKATLKPYVDEIKAVAKQIGELQAHQEAVQQAQAAGVPTPPPPDAEGAPSKPAGTPPLAAAPSPELAPAPVAPAA